MDIGDGCVKVLNDHNHPERMHIIEQEKMKEEMLRLCRETALPFKKIFDDVCRKHPDAGAHLSFQKLRPTLERGRLYCKPRVPETIVLLHEMILNYQPLQYLNVHYVVSEKNENAIILSSDILVKALSKSSELYVDGTFAVLPKKPHIAQLYSLHIRCTDTGIATLLILCEKRTATLYTAIWEKIIYLIPELPNNVKFIMSDYETAAVNTLSRLFPKADIHGCWFHYCQAVLRRWRKLGLHNAPHSIVRMAMSLPLVPAIKFVQGLSIIQTMADTASSKFPNILLFMTYMRRTWLNIASRVSVHNCPVRTNNIVELFHNIASQKLGKQNTNIWGKVGSSFCYLTATN
ncbi:LOW QUALITY PROTEIN: uncharacterized protein LOC143219411 [Lasioglossum baleicum]|uniref:LOW QUALITY PROTEIN: uncharacterized protein LOC143219411 n=1 Tax=Lasioglossum baleicum TaxID=434251 RepID=UPI003FCC62BF